MDFYTLFLCKILTKALLNDKSSNYLLDFFF